MSQSAACRAAEESGVESGPAEIEERVRVYVVSPTTREIFSLDPGGDVLPRDAGTVKGLDVVKKCKK